MCEEALAAVCYLRKVMLKLPGRTHEILLARLVGALAYSGLTKDEFVMQISQYSYIAIAGVLFIMSATVFFRRGGKKVCSGDA